MKFILEITLGNDAMQTYPEVRAAIHDTLDPDRLARAWRIFDRPQNEDGGGIKDINGNTVGHWKVIDETKRQVAYDDDNWPPPMR